MQFLGKTHYDSVTSDTLETTYFMKAINETYENSNIIFIINYNLINPHSEKYMLIQCSNY